MCFTIHFTGSQKQCSQTSQNLWQLHGEVKLKLRDGRYWTQLFYFNYNLTKVLLVWGQLYLPLWLVLSKSGTFSACLATSYTFMLKQLTVALACLKMVLEIFFCKHCSFFQLFSFLLSSRSGGYVILTLILITKRGGEVFKPLSLFE